MAILIGLWGCTPLCTGYTWEGAYSAAGGRGPQITQWCYALYHDHEHIIRYFVWKELISNLMGNKEE